MRRHIKVHTGHQPYQCRFCDRCFSQSSGVKSHERTHTGEKPYKCDHCSKQFVNKTNRRVHMRKCKDSKLLVFSREQLKTMLSQEELNMLPEISNEELGLTNRRDTKISGLEIEADSSEHSSQAAEGDERCHLEHETWPTLNVHRGNQQGSEESEGEKPFACSVCHRRFLYRGTLKRHLLLHTGEKPYMCQYCDKSFNQISHKTKHEHVHRKEAQKECGECDATFALASELVAHIKMSHGDGHYSQDDVNKSPDGGMASTRKVKPAKRQSWLHIKSLGSAGRSACGTPLGQFPCAACSKVCTTRGQWVQHQRCHTGEKPFVCQYCSMTFSHSGSVKRHAMVHHRIEVGPDIADKYLQNHSKPKKQRKEQMCHLCGKICGSISGMQYHLFSHNNLKFKCSFCGKDFKDKKSCNLHESVHRGEESHQCTYCGHKFAVKSRLITHERTHTGEKPYKCQYCDKAFAQQAALIIHERSHTGEKPFKCKICDKRFVQSEDLKRHERLHRGEKPYKCRYCDMRFTLKGSQTKHEKTHSKQQEAQTGLWPYQQDTLESFGQ